MRRERKLAGFAEAPSPQTVTQLDPAMKAVLQARMQMALSALKSGHALALQTAENWPELNWKTMIVGAYLPALIPIIGAATVPADVKNSVLSALRSMSTQISMREAAAQRVLDGSLSVDAWMTSVRETAKGITSILGGMSQGNAATNMMDRIGDAFADIASGITWLGQKAREVPQQVDKYKPFLIAGGVALGAFILYQYATAPLKLLPRGENQ